MDKLGSSPTSQPSIRSNQHWKVHKFQNQTFAMKAISLKSLYVNEKLFVVYMCVCCKTNGFRLSMKNWAHWIAAPLQIATHIRSIVDITSFLIDVMRYEPIRFEFCIQYSAVFHVAGVSFSVRMLCVNSEQPVYGLISFTILVQVLAATIDSLGMTQ